jgi:cysteine desulfurase/selenocysteine lyase
MSVFEGIQKQFPGLHQTVHNKPLVYLDNAATTQKPISVLNALDEAHRLLSANIHRGVHTLSEKATLRYEACREKARLFIHAQHLEEIVFTRGTTEAINLVATSFSDAFIQEGDEVLVSEMEHHSNIVPWYMACKRKKAVLRVIPMLEDGSLNMQAYRTLLNAKTRLVAVTHISNALGTVNPVREITQAAHAAGAKVLIDGAQAVPHTTVNVQDIGCDFYAFSAHKMYGPSGVGVLYGKKELLEKMPPYQGGGDMIAHVSFEYITYNTLPYKFEAGTPAIADTLGLSAAFDFLSQVGIDTIQSHEQRLLQYASDRLQRMPGLRIIGTAPDKAGVVSFTLEGIHPHDIGTVLDTEGVAIRTGHHCAQPVMKYFNVPATARASLAFYNTEQDIDRLVKGIEKVQRIFAS